MSTLKADTIVASDGSSPVTLTKQEAAKAWVNFNGTGTIAARDSLNTSSLTDISVANYTINFSDSFALADYGFSGASGTGASSGSYFSPTPFNSAPTTSAFSIRNAHSGSSQDDSAYISLNFHGDLA